MAWHGMAGTALPRRQSAPERGKQGGKAGKWQVGTGKGKGKASSVQAVQAQGKAGRTLEEWRVHCTSTYRVRYALRTTESAVCSLHQHQLRTNRTGERDRSPPATAQHGTSERATGRSADRTDRTRGAAAARRQAQACKGKPGTTRTTSSSACPSYLLLRRAVVHSSLTVNEMTYTLAR